MKRYHIYTIILTICFVFLAVHGVYAQTNPSISGDDLCGGATSTPCTAAHLKSLMQNVFKLIVMLGMPILIVFVSYRFLIAWIRLQQGNSGAYKEAIKEASQAIGGFMIIVALFGGVMYAVLKYFGVKSEGEFNPLNILKLITDNIDLFVPHAYAAGSQQYLPNPTLINSPFDFIMSVLRVIMKFIIYPGLIYIWVRSGMQFVIAQGNPDGLRKAKQWLLWAFVTTLVVFSVQGVVSVISTTATEVIGNRNSSTDTPPNKGTEDGRTPPKDGEDGTPCNYNGGGEGSGIMAGGECMPGRGAGSSNTGQFCKTKPVGTLCTTQANKVGVCGPNEEEIIGCYTAQNGDVCIDSNGNNGQIVGEGCVPAGGPR